MCPKREHREMIGWGKDRVLYHFTTKWLLLTNSLRKKHVLILTMSWIDHLYNPFVWKENLLQFTCCCLDFKFVLLLRTIFTHCTETFIQDVSEETPSPSCILRDLKMYNMDKTGFNGYWALPISIWKFLYD